MRAFIVGAVAALCVLGMLVLPTSPAVLMDRFPQVPSPQSPAASLRSPVLMDRFPSIRFDLFLKCPSISFSSNVPGRSAHAC